MPMFTNYIFVLVFGYLALALPLNNSDGVIVQRIEDGIEYTLSDLPNGQFIARVNNGIKQAKVDLAPVLKEFETMESLTNSPFWKNLQKQKDPIVAKSTAIKIKESDSIFYFKSSEWVDTNQVEELEVQGLIKRPKLGRPSSKDKYREIAMVEVQYGDSETKEVLDIPVSHCVSSVFSSGGATYSQSYTWKQKLSISITPQLSMMVAAIGASFSGSMDAVALSYSSTGGISCKAKPGGKVQVFSSIKYRFFPLARKRDVVIGGGSTDLERSEWSRIKSETGSGKGTFDMFGPIFFDLTTIPHHQCVTKAEYLDCDNPQNVLDMDDRTVDPRKGLTF